jgi:hypothetical protein
MAGAITIIVDGEGIGPFATRSASPSPTPIRKMMVPNASPTAIWVCPRAAASTAADRPSRSIPNSNAPSANAEMPAVMESLAVPRTADSAPAIRMTAPTIRRTTARNTRGD